MKRFPIKFPRRVRIHGGEFDASARAMHRSVRLAVPATIENVSIVTIERKQMSTKTTIKRVALVAVAAMGFGLLSVVPSQARSQGDSLTLSAATASIVAGDTITASSPSVTLAFLADSNASDSMTVTAYYISRPATSTAIPMLYVSDTTSAVVASTGGGSALAKGDSITTQIAYVKSDVATPASVSAKLNIGLSSNGGNTGTTVVGDYVVRLIATVTGSGGGTAVAGTKDVTITVKANPVTDTVATTATVVLGGLASNDSITSATDEVVTASKTVGATPSAVLSVALKNANGSATTGESYTAYIVSGPGTLCAPTRAATTTITGCTAGVSRMTNVVAGRGVGIFADGTSGVTTVQILSAAGVKLAEKSLTFYGAVDKIVATAAKTVVPYGSTTTTAVTFKAYDSAGVEVKAGVVAYTNSDKAAAISNAYNACETTYVAASSYWECKVVGVAAGTANLTVTTNSAATVTTGKTSNAVAVRVGGKAAELSDVLVAFDKATYAPGELALLTVTPVDAAGLVLADETYTVFTSAGLTTDYAFGSGSGFTTSTASVYSNGGAGVAPTSGVYTFKQYMPLSEGTVTVTYTTAAGVRTTAGVKATAVATVSSASGSAAIEAANAAQASADAATDAANAAAESADAATAAAQDAAQAVADLATQVADLIASLKAQLTALTALVVKIQKKVKA